MNILKESENHQDKSKGLLFRYENSRNKTVKTSRYIIR